MNLYLTISLLLILVVATYAMEKNTVEKHTVEKHTEAWKNVKVGADAAGSVEAIKSAHPDMRVFQVPEGSMMTMDFDENRIRVFHDDNGLVTRQPKTG